MSSLAKHIAKILVEHNMEIENACYYLARINEVEQIVFAISDGLNQDLRFIKHLSAGPEEALDRKSLDLVERLGYAHEIWQDDFAREILTIIVKNQLAFDTMESLQLVTTMKKQAIAITDTKKIVSLVRDIQAQSAQLHNSRNRLWHNFAHRAAL